MKNLLLIFSVLLSTSLSAVEYGNLTDPSQEILLNDGDTFVVLASSQNSGGNEGHNYGISVEVDGTLHILYFSDLNGFQYSDYDNYGVSSTSKETRTICGPGKVSINGNFFLSYELKRAAQYQNNNINIVSVPSDVQGAGTHNIVVETSSDLINWTPVHSSAISGGSEAFVRTRISTSE